MQQTSSSEPKKIRKRLRSRLPVSLAYLVVSLVIVCMSGGCCTYWAHKEFTEVKASWLERRHYDFSPDRREIVYSSVLATYRLDPYGKTFSERSEGRKFAKRIPLDPIPEGMFLITLVVEEDPSVGTAWSYNRDPAYKPKEPWWEAKKIFPAPLVRLGADGSVIDDPRAGTGIQQYGNVEPGVADACIWPDDTFRLNIHPNDRQFLTDPFYVRLDPWDTKRILVFPLGNEENRYRVLTSGRIDYRFKRAIGMMTLPQPFEEEFDAIAQKETRFKEDVTTDDKILVWGAVLVDVVCLPVEILYWIGYGIVHLF